MAARSKAWIYGRSLAGTAGANSAEAIVVCLLCLLSVLCYGPITHPEGSYWVCVCVCVSEFDRGTSKRRPIGQLGLEPLRGGSDKGGQLDELREPRFRRQLKQNITPYLMAFYFGSSNYSRFFTEAIPLVDNYNYT